MKIKRLPDAEFDIMKVVWANKPPITTNIVIEHLGEARGWKAQTVNSLMSRLIKRGFLHTEKTGRERLYFPIICKEDYLKSETDNFIKRYHNNSFLNLVSTLYDDKTLTDKEIEELSKWLKERGK